MSGSPFLIKLEVWSIIEIETPTQVFSFEFCEIFKNTFFIELLRWLLQRNLSNLPCWVLLPFSKAFKKFWQWITLHTFFVLKRYINTLFFIKTNTFHFMLTLLRFFGIWFWNVLNLFSIYSGQCAPIGVGFRIVSIRRRAHLYGVEHSE